MPQQFEWRMPGGPDAFLGSFALPQLLPCPSVRLSELACLSRCLWKKRIFFQNNAYAKKNCRDITHQSATLGRIFKCREKIPQDSRLSSPASQPPRAYVNRHPHWADQIFFSYLITLLVPALYSLYVSKRNGSSAMVKEDYLWSISCTEGEGEPSSSCSSMEVGKKTIAVVDWDDSLRCLN